MEVDGDDDFGDLYQDVEVEASSAINLTPHSSKTQPVIIEFGNHNSDNDRACVNIDNDEDEDDDDDDDDLDIVLNSDDNSNNKIGEGFTIANVKSREFDDENDDNLYLRSQSATYGSDLKGIGCVPAAYWQQLGSSSVGPQTAQRFSLPRARNILDVNIDVFEQKPWKNPGVDITDYFNFGFNENSWKVYCNQVDEYRHRGILSSGTPPLEQAQSTEVDRRKGQAIQVEDSIFERQSSMDVRSQLDRDSDAIQIKILDPEDTSEPEASNHGDDIGDEVTDHLSFSCASEDESVQEKYHGIHQVVADETIRTSNETKESYSVKESSEAEKIPANHSKSFEDYACIDRRKTYTYDRCLTELTRSVKPGYHHSEDSGKSDYKRGPDENRYYPRRFDDNRKHGNWIYHERSNSPVYKNRTHKDFNLKTHHEDDYIISKRSYDRRKSGEYEYHTRNSNDLFSLSDEMHSTFRQRLHAFDPYNYENISYSKSEVPSDYYDERFGYNDWDTERSGVYMDRTVFRSSEEDECYDERRSYIKDNKMMEGDWCCNEKGERKGENLYSRKKGEIDELGYYDDTHGESFKSVTYKDRKRYDVEYTRWEFRGPERNKRRVSSLFSELDNHLLKRDNVQSFASQSSEESHINKSSFYRRHGSYGGQFFEPFDREEDYMIDIDGRVDMRRKRCHWRSENEWEDEIMFRHEDAKFCDHRKGSYAFGKVSRRKTFVYEPEPDYLEEFVDDPYVVDGSGYVKELSESQLLNGCRYYKQKNEGISGNKFSKAYGKGHERLPLRCRHSPLVVGKVKPSKKHKKLVWMDLDTRINDKVARADETKAVGESLDMKEGQILTEQVKVGTKMDKTRSHVNGSHNQSGKSGLDNTRILEAMAKMEKRRARFNEPVAITKKNLDASIKLTVVDQVQETGSNKQQRPSRKRRWGANK